MEKTPRTIRTRGLAGFALGWLLGLACLMGVPANTLAGTEGAMNKMFDTLTTHTPGSVYMGSRRGVISGGSFYMRQGIANPPLASFRPPSFRAGCGGIDIFGGAFSFISAEQLQLLLRRIAQNAAGYAFQIAIEAMCPQCSTAMQRLQKMVQDLSSGMKNSCSMAKSIVNATGAKGIIEDLSQSVGQFATGLGVFSDTQAAQNNAGQKSTGKDIAANTAAKQFVERNVVWDAMSEGSIGSWFATIPNASGTDIPLPNLMMSLTGTVIYKYKTPSDDGLSNPDGSASVGADDQELAFESVAPIPNLMDKLLDGGTEIPYYDCVGTIDAPCLAVSQATGTLKGFRGIVYQMLIGSGSDKGIIEKMRSKALADSYTATEEGLIESTSITAILKQFKDTQTARAVASELGEVIAYDMLITMVRELITVAYSTVNGYSGKTNVTPAKELINRLQVDLQTLIAHRAGAARNASAAHQAASSYKTMVQGSRTAQYASGR